MAEVTQLTPQEEQAFQLWVQRNGITDVDHPNSHYDYRGFWKATGGAPRQPGLMSSHNDVVGPHGHFPDTFKQSGHPTFSQESQYSHGPSQGGLWVPNTQDVFLSQPKMAVSHDQPDLWPSDPDSGVEVSLMFPPNTPPPDPLGLMPPVQRQPMQAPPPPVMASQDPKQQLLAIATIGAMLGAGPKSGIGEGLGHGVLQGQQELQRLSDLHAQQSFRNEQILQEASRRQADDAADRQRQLQSAMMTITQRVQQIPDKATYDVEIGGYAKALQASGYRLDENWLRQAAPFVAPTAEKQAQRAMEAFTKNPANAELLKTHPDQLAKVLISFDVDGDGTPEQVPLMRVASIAKMPFATDESGQLITYPKGTSLELKADADGFLSGLVTQAKAEGKDVTDPTLLNDLRTQALKFAADAKAKEKAPSAAGSFEDYLTRYATEKGLKVDALNTRQIEEARKRYNQADDAVKPPQPGGLPIQTQRRVDAKSKAFDQLPVIKNAQVASEAVGFANSLNVNTTNPADDQGLIYAFAKAMDPNSVVREGEYATVQKYAQSWAQTFGFNAERIFANVAFLTPKARQNMKSTIQSKFAASKQQYDTVRKSFADQINKITGQNDGETWLTDYGAAFPEPAVSALDSARRKLTSAP